MKLLKIKTKKERIVINHEKKEVLKSIKSAFIPVVIIFVLTFLGTKVITKHENSHIFRIVVKGEVFRCEHLVSSESFDIILKNMDITMNNPNKTDLRTENYELFEKVSKNNVFRIEFSNLRFIEVSNTRPGDIVIIEGDIDENGHFRHFYSYDNLSY